MYKRGYLPGLLLFVLIAAACKQGKQRSISDLALRMARQAQVEKYPKVPHEELLNQVAGNKVYAELKSRYYSDLEELKFMTDSDGVKLSLVVLTPEVGNARTLANTMGIPYIATIAHKLGIDFTDFSEEIANIEAGTLTQAPFDKHWSKVGAYFMAEKLAQLIRGYADAHSHHTYTQHPNTFGDLETTKGDIVEEEQKRTYKLRVSEQGLRNDYEIMFPKRKQRILFLGDDWLYCPYLDNNLTITQVLQDRFPDKEILNAAHFDYTMEDYMTLYREKGRYAEPDIVIVCTNGDDILENFFSQRNRYSRAARAYKPINTEIEVYNQLFK